MKRVLIMKRLLNKAFFSTLILMVFFSIITFTFLLKSPLHPWIDAETSWDAGVFKTVAFMMDKGYMPYRDTFDHKGPLLYIINWIGNRIAFYKGVWIIEFIALFIMLLSIYKTARLYCGKLFSCIPVLASLYMLSDYFAGNLTEEYAMPFIAVSQFIFLDYLINKRVNKFRLILCGFCFGATCLLRPNMTAVWIVFGITILIMSICHKQFSDLKRFVMFFLLGGSIIIIPILLWLGINGALTAFWQDYIVFNREYVSVFGGGIISSTKLTAFFSLFNNPILILAAFISVYLCVKINRFLYGVYSCYLFLSLLLVSMSGNISWPYCMVLVPAVSFPIASFLSILSQGKSLSPLVRIDGGFIVAAYIISVVIMSDLSSIASAYADKGSNHRTEATEIISAYIQDKTMEDDAISVYGNWDIIYILSRRIHATKYSYQFPIYNVRPDIKQEYFEDLSKELPKIIVVQAGHYDEDISSFLKDNRYALVWPEEISLDSALMFELTDTNF